MESNHKGFGYLKKDSSNAKILWKTSKYLKICKEGWQFFSKKGGNLVREGWVLRRSYGT
jgi:hypothetical protein